MKKHINIDHELCFDGRRVVRRQAARVLVLCQARILLEENTDPGISGSSWWVTPGGGLEHTESYEQAAVRELFEETGLKLVPEAIGSPIASRTVIHGYSDRILIQDERFFKVQVQNFKVNSDRQTVSEKEKILGFGWFTFFEMGELNIWPAKLADLWHLVGDSINWGIVEESTVPVARKIII